MNRLVTKANITASEVIRGVCASGDGSDVRLALDITSLTGTTQLLDVSVEFTIDDQNFVFESTVASGYATAFAQASGVTKETIVVPNCPQLFDIRLAFTNTITDCDLTISGERV